MSKISFENYEVLAGDNLAGNLEAAGRYEFQFEAEKNIIIDIVNKLELNSDDSLLDIGCGPGNILIPLSKICKRSTGVDNKNSINRLKIADKSRGIETIVGNFLELNLSDSSFSKIIIYSVIQYLEDVNQVLKFIDSAIKLLTPGGRLLIGDLPNKDKKERFMKSPYGNKITNEWLEAISKAAHVPVAGINEDKKMVIIDDFLILSLIKHGRNLGLETYLMSQSSNLPFGYTREDLLFVKSK